MLDASTLLLRVRWLCLLRGALRSTIAFDVLDDRFAGQPARCAFQFSADASERVPGLIIAPKMLDWRLSHEQMISTFMADCQDLSLT